VGNSKSWFPCWFTQSVHPAQYIRWDCAPSLLHITVKSDYDSYSKNVPLSRICVYVCGLPINAPSDWARYNRGYQDVFRFISEELNTKLSKETSAGRFYPFHVDSNAIAVAGSTPVASARIMPGCI